jgi:hypothetical protein
MNDEQLPELFDRMNRQPAPAALRPRVLAAVGAELRRRPAWQRALEWSAAAVFLVGMAMFAWQQQEEAAWRARILHDAPPRPPAGGEYAGERHSLDQRYAQLLDELTRDAKGSSL